MINNNHEFKSLFVISTPKQVNNSIESILKLNKLQPKLQIIFICLDSIIGSRNAISELWLNERIIIKSFEKSTNDINSSSKSTTKKESYDLSPSRMDKRWNDLNTNEQKIDIEFENDVNVSFSLSNTLFVNGLINTCFIYEYDDKFLNNDINFENLSNISIKIPELKLDTIDKISYFNKLKKLNMSEEPDMEFKITSFEGNLIKTINDKPASQYLIENKEIQKSKKDLFFKLSQKDNESSYFKIIAGGLGWGEKAGYIAIDPIVTKLNLNKETKVELYQHDEMKVYDYEKEIYGSESDSDKKGVLFECTELETGYDNKVEEEEEERSVEGMVGMGSERGFKLNKKWQKSNGENIFAPLCCQF
ncbi:hypothetical protein CANARDRAFT_174772 [[Candida] arabinofermentans NRRL YB-2248]|uniref:FIST domain-containing protein n=1 Tax=[Candida] arabinofermentans NRRL YB-2248 TaxID=983967 RepID=A0A1E4T4R0_9ASCO|nr:hypothetical protein CANARDRAFT_174772 [[Candida] arabinofermentans NRRL YB-2248]